MKNKEKKKENGGRIKEYVVGGGVFKECHGKNKNV